MTGKKSYFARRALLLVPTFFLITLIVFIIVSLAPGDPLTHFYSLRPGQIWDPQQVEYMKHQLGLDRPVYEQYFYWLARVLQGNLGNSIIMGMPVAQLVLQRLMNTLVLGVVSFIISVTIGILFGVVSSVKQNSKSDYLLSSIAIFFSSISWQFYSLVVILVFSLFLRWFPTSGTSADPSGGAGIDIRYLILPAFVLGTSMSGLIMRLVRSSMLEVLRQDYIMTARAKGLSERVVIYKHALRNALLPVTTIVGVYFATLFTGCAVVETCFAWPGVGTLIVWASLLRDYPVLMGTVVVTATVILVTVFLMDVLYAYIDPRIRFGGRKL